MKYNIEKYLVIILLSLLINPISLSAESDYYIVNEYTNLEVTDYYERAWKKEKFPDPEPVRMGPGLKYPIIAYENCCGPVYIDNDRSTKSWYFVRRLVEPGDKLWFQPGWVQRSRYKPDGITLSRSEAIDKFGTRSGLYVKAKAVSKIDVFGDTKGLIASGRVPPVDPRAMAVSDSLAPGDSFVIDERFNRPGFHYVFPCLSSGCGSIRGGSGYISHEDYRKKCKIIEKSYHESIPTRADLATEELDDTDIRFIISLLLGATIFCLMLVLTVSIWEHRIIEKSIKGEPGSLRRMYLNTNLLKRIFKYTNKYKFICPVCQKAVFLYEFRFPCPFCHKEYDSDKQRIAPVIFDCCRGRSGCKDPIQWIECPKCKESINLFWQYDEKKYKEWRYGKNKR